MEISVVRLVTCCSKKQFQRGDECFQDTVDCGEAGFSAVHESHIVKWLFSPMDPLIQQRLAEKTFAVANLYWNDPVVTKDCNSVKWQLLFWRRNKTFKLSLNETNVFIEFFSPYCKCLQMKQIFWCGDQPTGGINLQLVSHSWVFSLSLTACPLTRKANCALENIYEPGREIGLRSVDKQGGDGGEEEKKKEKTWNPRWDRGYNAIPLKRPGG